MKNIIYKLGLFVLLGAGFASCEEDKVILPSNANEQYAFENQSEDFAVSNDVNTHIVYFGATNATNADRVIPVTIDATSTTATPAQYSVPATVTIPAGQRVGELLITANPSELPEGQEFTLTLTIDNNAYPIIDEKYFNVVTLFKTCATESLAGSHTYRTYNMFSPDTSAPNEATGTVVWTETGTGVYRTSDFSFGMYVAVGYGGASTSATAVVNWTCQGVTTGGVDQFNDSFTYNITSIEGAVMTIDWFNGYGDTGTTELTRAGGEAWPQELLQ